MPYGRSGIRSRLNDGWSGLRIDVAREISLYRQSLKSQREPGDLTAENPSSVLFTEWLSLARLQAMFWESGE